jgi:V/A-type H+-transporting ATPase subunit E
VINQTQVEELESALQARASALAAEYRASGQASRERILRDMQEKLRLREERELLAAKAGADRSYEQRVQAGELRLQAGLDALKWALVQTSVQAMPGGALVAHLGHADHERLGDRWMQWTRELIGDRELRLDAHPIETIGGVVIEDAEARTRIDNSFEGRMARLRERLHQTIFDRLFAGVPETGSFFNG